VTRKDPKKPAFGTFEQMFFHLFINRGIFIGKSKVELVSVSGAGDGARSACSHTSRHGKIHENRKKSMRG